MSFLSCPWSRQFYVTESMNPLVLSVTAAVFTEKKSDTLSLCVCVCVCARARLFFFLIFWYITDTITLHFGPCEEDGSSVWGLQQSAPYVQENLRHWGREGHKKGYKPDLCASRGKEMQTTQSVGRSVSLSRGPALQPAGCASRDKMVYCYCSLNIFGS